jgi:bifunctional non-homologous end joining protein LigD
MKIKGKEINITHDDKIYYPRAEITKGQIIDYYLSVSKLILPYLKDRPLTMFRAPDGLKKAGFFQKNAGDYFPSWIATKKIKHRHQEGSTNHVLCNDQATLIYLVDQGCLEFHIWLSQINHPDKPDRIVFDLDLPKESFAKVKKAALDLKSLLDNLDIPAFLMTTGSKGLHVVIPIQVKFGYAEVRQYALKIIDLFIKKHPKGYTRQSKKSGREDKVYLDYLRNAFAQTHICPFSTRVREGAPIAVPISWEDLQKKGFHSGYYNVQNAGKSFLRRKKDPWKEFDNCRIDPAKMQEIS